MTFQDRTEAGRRLAHALAYLADADVVVVALAAGGVPIAREIATSLGAPMDILVVEDLCPPERPDTIVGAVGPDGTYSVDRRRMSDLEARDHPIESMVGSGSRRAAGRTERYQPYQDNPGLRNRTVLLVDEGVEAGDCIRVAARLLRQQGPSRIVLATPVAASPVLDGLRAEMDGLAVLIAPEDLGRIEDWYDDFEPVTDEAALHLLGGPQELAPAPPRMGPPPPIRVDPAPEIEREREPDA